VSSVVGGAGGEFSCCEHLLIVHLSTFPDLCRHYMRIVSTRLHSKNGIRHSPLFTRHSSLVMRSLTIYICSCLILSCGGHSPSPSNDPEVFVYNEPDGILSLDPAVATYTGAIWTSLHLFNGLVELDSALHIAPCIARSWNVDATGREWTFHLRSDVWFHDDECFGTKRTRRVTANDVRYSIERICDARTKSTGLWAFRTKIVGADEYHMKTRQGISGHIKGIVVDNDSTLRITLTKPFAPFLAVLTMPYGSIIPHEAIEAHGADFGRHPVGTGPFAFGFWKQDVELRLKRNPRYWKVDSQGTHLPYLKEVSITFLRDTKNEFLEFTRKRYDMVASVDVTLFSNIFDPSGKLKPPYDVYQSYRAPSQSIEYYGIMLDTTAPVYKNEQARGKRPTLNKAFRKALNYAIDRHRIVTYVLNGRAIPAHHGVLPMSLPGASDSINGYRYDVDEARKLLAAAGYPNGKGCPPLLLQLGNSPRTASVAEAIQQQWRELGITVELRQVDFPQHLAMVRGGELALWRTSWLGDYPDPENFLALFVSENIAPRGPNTTRISRADLDSLYEAALDPRLTFDERCALYHAMERIVIEEAPWIFIYHEILFRILQPNVRGFILDGTGRLVLERVHKSNR